MVWLQATGMEDWVDLQPCWKLKFVGYLSYSSYYGEGTFVLTYQPLMNFPEYFELLGL